MERFKSLASIAVLVWFAAFALYFIVGCGAAINRNVCIAGFTGCTK